MGLQISAKKRVGYKIASLIAIFAVVAQPMYGLVASQIAQAESGKITSIVFENEPQTINKDTSSKLQVRTKNSTGSNEKLAPKGSLEISSSSPTGRFAEVATSDFSSSNEASFTFKSGDSLKSFFYKDATPGQHTITITLSGEKIDPQLVATQQITVNNPTVQTPVPDTEVPTGTTDVDELPQATITTPAEGSFVRTNAWPDTNKLKIEGTFTDDRAVNRLQLQLVRPGFGSVGLELVRTGYLTTGGPFTHQMSVNPNQIVDGRYELTYIPVDYNPTTGGQFGSKQSRWFTIDNTKPTVTIDTPTVGQLTHKSGVGQASFSANDVTSGLKSVDANLFNATNTNFIRSIGQNNTLDGVPNWSGGWAIPTDLEDGTYTIRFSAHDRSGNVETVSRTFTVDSTAPKITSVSQSEIVEINGTKYTSAKLNNGFLDVKFTTNEPLNINESRMMIAIPGYGVPSTGYTSVSVVAGESNTYLASLNLKDGMATGQTDFFKDKMFEGVRLR